MVYLEVLDLVARHLAFQGSCNLLAFQMTGDLCATLNISCPEIHSATSSPSWLPIHFRETYRTRKCNLECFASLVSELLIHMYIPDTDMYMAMFPLIGNAETASVTIKHDDIRITLEMENDDFIVSADCRSVCASVLPCLVHHFLLTAL